VLLTLLADTIAMARHPSMWASAVSSRELIVLLGSLAVIASAVQTLIRNSQARVADTQSTPWGRTGFTALLATLVLAVYPERLIQRTGAHLLTVVIGAFLLFAPMRMLLISLVPYTQDEGLTGRISQGTTVLNPRHRWGIVVAVGVLIGALAFFGEMSEGGSPMPLSRLLFVASVFVGLGVAGLLIAYAFLAAPLGLGPRGREQAQ
jgi:hypothetical protein